MVQIASSPQLRPLRSRNYAESSSAVRSAAVRVGATKTKTAPSRSTQIAAAPKLVVLDKPATLKSSVPFTIICTLVLLGALVAGLLLNISMSNTSYKITNLQVELQALNESAQSLEEQVELLGTPQELERQARELGMVPANQIQYIDLASQKIVGSASISTTVAANPVKFVPNSKVLVPGEMGWQYGMGNERD